MNRQSDVQLKFTPNPEFLKQSSTDANPILTSQVIQHLISTDNQFTSSLKKLSEQQRLKLSTQQTSLPVSVAGISYVPDSRFAQL